MDVLARAEYCKEQKSPLSIRRQSHHQIESNYQLLFEGDLFFLSKSAPTHGCK